MFPTIMTCTDSRTYKNIKKPFKILSESDKNRFQNGFKKSLDGGETPSDPIDHADPIDPLDPVDPIDPGLRSG